MKFFTHAHDGIFKSSSDQSVELGDEYVLMLSGKRTYLLYNSGHIRTIMPAIYTPRKINNYVKKGVWREISIDELHKAGFKIE